MTIQLEVTQPNIHVDFFSKLVAEASRDSNINISSIRWATNQQGSHIGLIECDPLMNVPLVISLANVALDNKLLEDFYFFEIFPGGDRKKLWINWPAKN